MLDAARRPFTASVLLGLAYALLFGVACRWPEGWLGTLAIAGPIPLLSAGLRSSRLRWTWLGVAIGSSPLWIYFHHWIWTNNVSRVGAAALVVYLSAYSGVLPVVLGVVRRGLGMRLALLLTPCLWTGLEFLRGEVLFYGYPWYLSAHPLIGSWPWSLWGPVAGAYGVGFVLVAWLSTAYALRAAKTSPTWKGAAIGGGLAAIAAVGGGLAPGSPTPGRTVRVAAVQTNVPQDNRAAWTLDDRISDFQRFAQLTEGAARADAPPDMIVWPETMYPGFHGLTEDALDAQARLAAANSGFAYLNEFPAVLAGLQAQLGPPLLVGAAALEAPTLTVRDGRVEATARRTFNSVYVLDAGRVTGERYDKIGLAPFGEVMPYFEHWPWLEERLLILGARGMSFQLDRGRRYDPLAVRGPGGPWMVASPICFEATQPATCRRLAYAGGRRRADFLVNVTNDGWFGRFDAGRRMHLLLSRWRCLELGLPMVRAANTGVSAAIGPRGELIATGPNLGPRPGPAARADGVLIADLEIPARADDGPRTIYARLGDLPAVLCLAATIVALVASIVRRRGSPGSSGARAHPAEE